MENGFFNLRKSADLLFFVDSVISVAKSSSFVVLVSFVVHPLSVRFASRYRLSVAFGSKVVDRTLNSTTKYTNHTKRRLCVLPGQILFFRGFGVFRG